MLYERWLQIANGRPHDIALVDVAGGRSWTFQDLVGAAESETTSGPLVCPQGCQPKFIIDVLRGWRSGAVVCPLETGQSSPSWTSLPPECVHLKTTSASTGTARLIAFTAAQLRADADQIVTTMGLRPDWPNLGMISLAHSYGFSNLVLPLLLHGVPLILGDSPLPETLRRSARIAEQLTLAGVPALWRAWSEAKAIPQNVRLAISAGAPLPLALEIEVFQSCGVKIHNFYGASECGGIAYDRSATPRTDSSLVGTALENVQLTLNAEGCLRVSSPAVGTTYWPEPASHLSSGCFQTSDLARLKSDAVFLQGRQTDEINVAGRKVSPELIERVLATHPSVRDCVVFGIPSTDPDRTEKIVASVAARALVEPEALRDHLLATLPAWQVPREWWFVSDLQPDARGKLSRAQWRARYLDRK